MLLGSCKLRCFDGGHVEVLKLKIVDKHSKTILNRVISEDVDVAKALFNTVQKNKKTFNVNHCRYHILEYKSFDANKSNQRSTRKNRVVDFTIDKSSQIIYLYRTNPSCKMHGHKIECVNADIDSIRIAKKVRVNIKYCSTCKKYFVSEESLKGYERKHGVLLFIRQYDLDYYPTYSNNKEKTKLSKLGSLGYTVESGSLSEYDRECLLSIIIDKNLMKKSDIIIWLNHLIKYNGKNKNNYQAKKKWEHDLQFVNEYNSERQRTITGYINRNLV